MRGGHEIPLADRGLSYGDGLFETLRIVAGEPWAIDAHHARLSMGCTALGLPVPSLAQLRAEFVRWYSEQPVTSDAGILKLLLTAGVGDRGYARPATVAPQRYWQQSALPEPRVSGLTVALLAESGGWDFPRLRGLKHLNRLPQVVLRSRWPADAQEALVYDANGLIHGGTQSNVCWFESGRWFTPPIRGASIAGTVRAQLIHRLGVIREPLSVGRLSLATAMVMTNAVRGVEPVVRVGARVLDPAPARMLQADWQALGAVTAADWLAVWHSE